MLCQSFQSLGEKLGMGNRLRLDEGLDRHATLRLGGAAAVWAEVETREELSALKTLARHESMNVYVVGLGSNVLFPDNGISGLVIRLGGEFARWEVHDADSTAFVTVGGGTINAHLVRGLLKQGFVGAEFLSLIPGTLGGAVALNAGTKEKEIESLLHRVELMTFDAQNETLVTSVIERKNLAMSYRHAELPEGAIVVSAVLGVERGDIEEAYERVRFDKDRRNETQPYRLASVGSTFANPEGDFAGRLIEAVGLKGTSIGGARISPLHANFFINEDRASSHDFLSLMALARVKVRERFGVELRPEVRFVGFDGWSRLLEIEHRMELGA